MTIRDELLEIDTKNFIDCTLIGCILEYSGHPVVFERTRLLGSRYVFFGPAKSTVQFLQNTALMSYNPEEWGNFPIGCIDPRSHAA